MKKILLDSNKNFYKANMHCHSVLSDGTQTLEELKKDYMSEGYSVVAFTDHEHLVDNSYLNEENFLALTSCELAVKEIENVSTLKKLDMKVCHLNLYSMDAHNINTPCYSSVYDHYISSAKDRIYVSEKDYKRVYCAEGISDIIKTANEQGFLVSYNHPAWSLEDARDCLGYEGLWALEIYNHACHDGGIYSFCPEIFDAFLRKGDNIACIAGDDNHNNTGRFGGFTMINAERLEYGDIMEALKNHNFYASMGPIINSLYIEDNKAHISVRSDARKVVMSTDTRRASKVDITEETSIDDIVFEFGNEYKYVRFSVIDEKGRIATTNAYFL